ncbi:HutD family protein [Agromyces sp. M3QZ16-3]|uniref:HutD family protein n=1 Tax=Agromyces sp. M3QZ16-3 TaxID=3447585 RepID=UPI003F693C80
MAAEPDVVVPSDVTAELWANGLGITRVMARRLAWRLSIAEIRGRMRFSSLPGVDRVLIPLGDHPLPLNIDGRWHHVEPGHGVRFAGESRVLPSTGGRAVSVVNLMVRRGLADVSWHVSSHRGFIPVPPSAAAAVVLSATTATGGLALPAGTTLLPATHSRSVACAEALVARFDITSTDT